MTVAVASTPATLERIRRTLVGLKMPRALEVPDQIVRQLEHGQISALEAIDTLLAEELSVRESRRIKTALVMARLTAINTLAGFDFSFQPSLDRSRILTLAQLEFLDRNEVVHVLGPPGTGKSHLAVGLGVEAVKAGRVCRSCSAYGPPAIRNTLQDALGTEARRELGSLWLRPDRDVSRSGVCAAASRSATSSEQKPKNCRCAIESISVLFN